MRRSFCQTIELFDLLNGTLIEGEQQRQETDCQSAESCRNTLPKI